jgi:pyruvate dehydrogenase E2 component (dihydrolipoamide acetyltransferase)
VARDILMPQMGYDMTEGTLVRWVKKVGDKVHRGDVVAEIETDKATVEVEAFEAGTLLRIIANPGETLPVGQPIATIGEAGEALPAMKQAAPPAPAAAPAPVAPPQATAAAPAPAAPAPPARKPATATPASPAKEPAADAVTAREPGERALASPLARRTAEQLGVDLTSVRGSGPRGRIVVADVEAWAETGTRPVAAAEPEAAPSQPATPPVPQSPAAPPVPEIPGAALPPLPEGAEDIEPSRLRQTIARRMGESKRTIPHFYVAVDCRADALLKLRQDLAARKIKVSVNDMLVKALALAALAHPGVNAAYLGGVVRKFASVDVGIAVTTDNGLLSPAVQDVGSKSLEEVAAATRDLAERARAGRLRPEEYGGGTITLSNLGMYGVDEFLAIINPPQAVIVSVGAASDRVVPVKGKAGIAKVLTAWAAADHRVLDGAQVGEFMATFRSIVEDPGQLTD